MSKYLYQRSECSRYQYENVVIICHLWLENYIACYYHFRFFYLSSITFYSDPPECRRLNILFRVNIIAVGLYIFFMSIRFLQHASIIKYKPYSDIKSWVQINPWRKHETFPLLPHIDIFLFKDKMESPKLPSSHLYLLCIAAKLVKRGSNVN